jgi:serine/threonine-protein kinase
MQQELATPATLAAGQHVTPTLRLAGELGQGGMGCVWTADHLTLKTQVAVKFLAEHSASNPDAVARFSAEAAAAARIRSPHVVQVFDHGVSDGTPYIVMELLEGEDLARRLARDGRVPPAETAVVIGQLCKALGRAHAMGIVHRDVKPANVFLVSGIGETFVKVLDFGLAKHAGGGPMSEMTGSGTVFGTPHYVSPEQAESAREASPQSDLWSVAVVAYECLTGKRPFAGDNLMALCIALHEGRYVKPTSHCPELPEAVDAWFERAFQHDPSERFASASELATTLADVLAGVPAITTPLDGSPAAASNTRATWSRGTSRRRTRTASARSWAWPVAVAAVAITGLLVVQRLVASRAVAVAQQPLAPSTVAVAAEPPSREVRPAMDPAPAASSPAAEPAQPTAAKATGPAFVRPVRPAARPVLPPAAAPAPSPARTPASELFSDPKN